MTVIKFNNKGVDRSKNFKPADVPSVGMHRCKIIECRAETPKGKDGRLAVVYAIDEPTTSKGYRLYEYIPFTEATKWKYDQFLMAVGIEKQVGSFDTNKQVGKIVTVRVKHEEYNNETRAKPNGVWAYDESEDDDAEYPEPDEDGEEEEYDEDLEDEEEELEDDDEEEELDEDEEELDEDEELDEEEDDEEELDEDDEEEDDEEEPAPPVKKAPAKKAAPAKATTKKAPAKKAAATTTRKRAAASEPEDNYESLTVGQLKKALRERELDVRGPQSALIARLRANDADPFDG